jgi:hypothetical protein
MLIAAGSAQAQLNSSLASPQGAAVSVASAGESGSMIGTNESSSSAVIAPEGAGATPAAGAAGQNEPQKGGLFSHMTFEAGAGFNAPSSNSGDYITWGGNFTGGTGYRFNRRISALVEYQFIDDKLPGALIGETGANGGYAHIWSLTAEPVVDLFPSRTNDIYATGGGGFYRKVTNFTDPVEGEYCTYYYCGVVVQNQVVGHFSSNQGGWNIGGGFSHRMGGVYGDGKMKLFAEARYLDIMTPAVSSEPNGLGKTTVAADTKLIPVTLGVRF